LRVLKLLLTHLFRANSKTPKRDAETDMDVKKDTEERLERWLNIKLLLMKRVHIELKSII